MEVPPRWVFDFTELPRRKEEGYELKKRKVIIDCDPGIDDSLALMMALSMEELEVVGITIVCGNCPVDMGVSNARKILRQMKRLDIPVYRGAERPLRRAYVDALDTHGSDGLGESFLPEAAKEEICREDTFAYGSAAVTFLTESIRQTGCSVIALGPMTNLAELIRKDAETFCRIEEIVSMGGNFKSHGNCSPVAEYNYWADPDAAALVYETAWKQGKRIAMVGLDVTRRIVLTPDLLEYMKRLDPETGSFVQAITRFYFDFHWKQEHLIGCVINDPLAVAYFADRTLCEGLEAYTEVVTDGPAMGQTIVDSMHIYQKEPNALVLTQTDPLRFFKQFFGRLLGMEEEALDLLPVMVRQDKEAAV